MKNSTVRNIFKPTRHQKKKGFQIKCIIKEDLLNVQKKKGKPSSHYVSVFLHCQYVDTLLSHSICRMLCGLDYTVRIINDAIMQTTFIMFASSDCNEHKEPTTVTKIKTKRTLCMSNNPIKISQKLISSVLSIFLLHTHI